MEFVLLWKLCNGISGLFLSFYGNNFLYLFYSMLQAQLTIALDPKMLPYGIQDIIKNSPDLFILVDQQIFPIHRKLFQSSGYIRYEISPT